MCDSASWDTSNLQHQTQFEMKHHLVDFWSLILKEKISAVSSLKQGHTTKLEKFEINDFVVSCFMERIVAFSSSKILEQPIIANIIDS